MLWRFEAMWILNITAVGLTDQGKYKGGADILPQFYSKMIR